MRNHDQTKARLLEELKGLRQKVKKSEKIELEHKTITEALLESENLYRMIFESANDGIIIHDAKGRIFDVNQTMYKRLGYTKQELLKMSLKDLVTPEFAKKVKDRVSRLKEEGVAIFESADQRKDGTAMPVEVSARYIDYKGQKLILSIVRDIHERKLAEDLIMSTYQEKEIVLEEIKRHTKVDQEIFLRILEQGFSAFTKKQEAESIKNARNRIKSMTFIKERMYRTPSVSKIDLAEPIKQLVRFMSSLYPAGIKKIQIQTEIQNTSLDLARAITLSLIINELLSNSLKHAFPDDRKGEIIINLRKAECGTQILHFRDNGIGFPDTLDFRKTSTLGLQLVMDLVDQLDGEIELRRSEGTEFIVQF